MDSYPYCGWPIPYAERRYGDPVCCGGRRTLGDGAPVGVLSDEGLFRRAEAGRAGMPVAGA